MLQQSSILAFFGDAQGAREAFERVRRAGFRQSVLVSKTSEVSGDTKNATPVFKTTRPSSIAPFAAAAGAALGLGLSQIAPVPRSLKPILGGAFTVVGGGTGFLLGNTWDKAVPEALVKEHQAFLATGESLVIVRAGTPAELRAAMELLRGEGEGGPVIFLQRAQAKRFDASKAPLRRDVLNTEALRELGASLGAKHKGAINPRSLAANAFLLGRLQQNQKIIARVARGLGEAARLGQPVSLSTEWLLDNNYIVQAQIKDVERNLTPKFYGELPVIQSGQYKGVPRLYVLASELVAATDSRLDREHLTDFIHAYQTTATLSTGELWALPLMLRLALIENLRRLTAQADVRQRERERADFWSNRLLSAAYREPDQLLPLLAQLTKEQSKLAPHFADRLVSHLFDEEAALGPVRSWLERKLDSPLADITSREQRRQAADSVSVGNVITTMRFLANLDWRECFEQLSQVDAILAQDPAGVYRSMDFATRDRYRGQVEKIARRAKTDELRVARLAVEHAASSNLERMRRATTSHGGREHEALIYQPPGHVGFYLIDQGRDEFTRELGYSKTLGSRTRRWVKKYPNIWYFGGIVVGTVIAMTFLARFARLIGAGLPLPLRLLSLLPSSEIAVQVVNYAATRILPPRSLAKMEFRDGVPERWKTAIVIPMLLGSVQDAADAARSIELHYLSDPDPNFQFALLADYVDATVPNTPDDEPRLQRAIEGIKYLNERYGPQFHLFIRDRKWSETEERWMGWERKRGKLEEFNRVLLGKGGRCSDEMHEIEGDPTQLHNISFVVTLDADTQLPFGAARRMVETLAHPLNRPVVNFKGNGVERGYGLIQPRVDTMLPSAMATRFSRLFSDASGSDPYTHVISDVYQDAFGEGSYHGKGIYDLEVFDRVLGSRFPDATLLSHDLIEGAHVRVGVASDIVLLDKFPPNYLASAKRDHRWIRGDWQIADWLFGSVPSRDGRGANPLSLLNRWKIGDNLRRSLLAPAAVALLVGGWVAGGSAAVAVSVGVAGLMLWPTGINIFTRLTTKPESLIRSHHEVRRGLVRAFVETSLMLHRSGLCLDATARALFRTKVSHKLLLEWQTAASTYGGARTQQTSFILRLATGSAIAGIIASFLALQGGAALIAATPYLLTWAGAPFVAWWLAGGRKTLLQRETTALEENYLRPIARETWRYFDDFVGPQTNWLPPDNYQEALNVEIAQRTSPTNIGLWLLATVAALDFGWLTLDEVAARNLQTLKTLGELEKHEGHLLNWYHSGTTEALRPRYVSTVDSGNLLGSLWTLARSMKEVYRSPLFEAKAVRGLRDVVDLLERALGDEKKTFEVELAEVRRVLVQDVSSSIEIIATLRSLERPVGALSRSLSLRPAKRQPSLRSRSNLESATSDPRISISTPAYWVAQLETQLDGWTQTVGRYGRWLELLSRPADEFLISLGNDAAHIRRELLAISPSLIQLSQGGIPGLEAFLARGDGAGISPEVTRWTREVSEEFSRACWLAGEMLAQCEAVVDRSRGLADDMNMSFLYDPARKLFSIGFNVDDRRLDNSHYDLLASECRLASFCSVARGDVPSDHWIALGRRFGQTPAGAALMSWSGTMFEYLMPMLFQRAFDNSLLQNAVQVAVEAQIAYGAARGVPWGISEAAFSALDANNIYQYKAFGCPGLGLKRGLEDDLVVAPYASLMALMVEPDAAVANLKKLENMGMRGDYGFYESIDFTRERLEEDSLVAANEGETARAGGRTGALGKRGAIVRCFMVHHQGMALLAMQNVLCGWPVQRRFHSDAFVEAAEPLLFEKIPEAAPILESSVTVEARPTRVDLGSSQTERSISPDTPAPRAHLLGSERMNTMLTAAGGGYTRWRDTELTRWRSDTTRDNWGQFVYIKDLETGVAWSATHQPLQRVTQRVGVRFRAEKVEFERRGVNIETRLDVCVSPEDDAEVRRVTLLNHSSRAREVELTTFSELSLAPHVADRAHPAFNKLFIQTAIVPEHDALLAWRRPRKTGDKVVWAAHLMASNTNALKVEFETDRSQFLGRGRANDNPIALEGALSGTVGAVLDPCFALRRRVVLQPGQRVAVSFVLCAAETETEVQKLIEKYNDFGSCERAFDLAWTHSQLELHHLQISPDEAAAFQQLAGYLLYPHAALRAPAKRVRDNHKGQSGLWAYGISGDLPIVVVAVDNARDLPAVRQAIMAHTFWRVRGLMCDLVILNEQAGGYAQDLTQTLQKMVASSTPYTGTEKPGGVFLRTVDTVSPEDLTLLYAVARVVLVAARGTLAQQLGAINDDLEPAPRFVGSAKESIEPSLALPFLELPYFNSLGGFTNDGREYAIYLGRRDRTPAPWINVFAHEHFGSIVSESGQGFSWFGNSQSNRLTPWSNDAVSDTPVEAIYIRDEETGTYWTPTPLPIRESEAYRARHGQGYSVFEHSTHGLETELTMFVPLGLNSNFPLGTPPVKVSRLKIKNRSGRRRRLTFTFYAELVLGTTREENQMHVVSSWDTEANALLARNAYNPDFASRVVFAAASPIAASHSADRSAFLGRNGNPATPAAMSRKTIGDKTGAGLDPCVALQVSVDLAPNEERSISFLLGEAATVEEARTVIAMLRDQPNVERALLDTKNWWDETLDTIKVETPDLAVNFLLNRWLPYQTLSCRIWARSALYQSGGAWGFRDQLQDSLALATLRPSVTREQILRSARQQFEEGDVQHWWHPPGNAGVRTLITDDLLFLPYAVAHYVKTTGDTTILDEEVPFLHAEVLAEGEHEKYFQPQISPESATIFEHCRRAIEKGSTHGAHGLTLIGGGDWNDGLNRVGIEGRGESVWLTWFIATVLRDFAPLCEQKEQPDTAQTYRTRADAYVAAIDAGAWDGEWYRRGYFDDGTPLGSHESEEAKIDSLPQSWALITGGGDPERAKTAMQSLETHLIKKEDKLVLLFTPAFDHSPHDPGYIKGYLPGVRENGGQYTHAACWVAYAYAKSGQGRKAVETLRLLNPVEHARTPEDVNRYKVEPYVVAADVYNLEGHVGRGGWTWYTGSCGWMYRAWIEGVLGFDRRGDKLVMNPSLPPDWKSCRLTYKHGASTFVIVIDNAAGIESGVAEVLLDGQILPSLEIPLSDDGAIHQVVVRMDERRPLALPNNGVAETNGAASVADGEVAHS